MSGDNTHNMTTRSKLVSQEMKSPESEVSFDSEVDEHGNLKEFIDYEEEDDFDQKEFNKVLQRLSGNRTTSNKAPKKKIKKKENKNNKLNDVFMTYLIMRATEKANEDMKTKRKKNKSKIRVTEEPQSEILLDKEEVNLDGDTDSDTDISNDKSIDNSSLITILNAELPDTESDDESFTSCEKSTDEDIEMSDLVSDKSSDKLSEETEETEEEEFTYEYDDLDDQYEELIDKQMLLNSEESNMEYYHYLSKEQKESLLQTTKEIYEINGSNTPLRFKVIQSDMDMKTKAIALENIDKMSEMDVSTGEHSKMDNWINGLMKIPFGIYSNIPVTHESSTDIKRNYIKETYQTLNKAIYGHKEAKTHILQVIGKWIRNPDSGGNVLAIQGPMGNGKTTLVKDGISKVLNRPFAFIALGGASDSAYFDGHCFTYEGSHWGRIVQILQESKCMNPVFYFDELDKISDTTKGEEIIHMLTHLTDPSQNTLFQDNYFPGVNLDLSRALFIFSYNDESKVNRILRDRMYVIHTKGFKTEDKLKICNEYLIPEIFGTFAFDKEIIFTDEIIKNIIKGHTGGEEGVRNLKRCIETIVSKINIHVLSDGNDELSFVLKNFSLPVTLNKEHIEILLKDCVKDDKVPFGMYC
jgi:ATP-dependent Lon protease